MTDLPDGPREVDVCVVGAGPVGLYGAYYTGQRGLSVAVVDSLSEVGGQVSAMYPEKQIYDVAGFPAVTGRDLVRGLVAQAAQMQPVYLLGQEAQGLERLEDGRLRVSTTRTDVTCRALVLTGGIGTFTPRPLPAGEEFLGRGLEYFVPSSQEYVGREVVVVGGGDSALDWAMMLEPLASGVTLVHRRDAFRGHEASVAKVRSSGVRILTGAQVTALEGGAVLERAQVSVRGEDEPRVLRCDKVVAALGFTAHLGPLQEWGLELRDNRHVVVDTAMRTNLPGVFAAGDITEYDGKVRLISTGFGEVATAVNNAAVHIDPHAHVFPGHTSNDPHEVPVPA